MDALLFFIPIAFVPIGIWAGHKFLIELRAHHAAEWKHLGRPELFSYGSNREEERKWHALMLTRKYAKLGNRRLTRLGDIFNLWLLFSFVSLTIWVFFGHSFHLGTGKG